MLRETPTSRKTNTFLRARHTHIEGEKYTQRERHTNSHTKRDTQTLRERDPPTHLGGRDTHTERHTQTLKIDTQH